MAVEAFTVFAANYGTLRAAEADFDEVREEYLTAGLLDSYDAAVVTRTGPGKVSIVVKHEPPGRRPAWRGLGTGLAGGVLVALFPAVGIGTGLLLGEAGAPVSAPWPVRSAPGWGASLKELGELLDEGPSGLVVAASHLDDRVRSAITRPGPRRPYPGRRPRWPRRRLRPEPRSGSPRVFSHRVTGRRRPGQAAHGRRAQRGGVSGGQVQPARRPLLTVSPCSHSA
jgi:hypothetical protein